MITREQFADVFKGVAASAEKRRSLYLRVFFLSLLLAAGVIAAAFYAGEWVLVRLSLAMRALGEQMGWAIFQDEISRVDVYSLYFIAVCAAVWLVLYPIFAYRGSNQSAAIKTFRWHSYSLKDDCYSKLFAAFGPLEFAPRGGVPLQDLKRSTILPPYQGYLSEDYIVGVVNDMTVKISEANFFGVKERERLSVFKGLLIVVDICESRVKLRGTFRGHTVLTCDKKKAEAAIQQKYSHMQRFALPAAYEASFEAFTTNAAEAAKLLDRQVLAEMSGFAAKASGLTQQVEHFDTKIAHAMAELHERLASMPLHKSLPEEGAFAKVYATKIDLTKSDPASLEPLAIRQSLEMEFYDDKILVAIPCNHDLFEPNSLFEPALNDEDADIVYAMMSSIHHLTRHIDGALKTN